MCVHTHMHTHTVITHFHWIKRDLVMMRIRIMII